MNREAYLGDGLYASYDGFQVKLRAPRYTEDHEVYLDSHVLKCFFAFVEKTYQVRIKIEKQSAEVSHG